MHIVRRSPVDAAVIKSQTNFGDVTEQGRDSNSHPGHYCASVMRMSALRLALR